MITSFSTTQKILMGGMILALVVLATDFLFDRSLRYIPYAGLAFSCSVGLQILIIGLRQVDEVRGQGQDAVWHRQPAVLIGIVILFGAFFWLMSTVIDVRLPHATVDIINIVLLAIGIIPYFLFFRAIFFGVKNMQGRRGRR